MKKKSNGTGIAVIGVKGFQKPGTATTPRIKESKEEEARRLQRRAASQRTRDKTHLVALRFTHKTYDDLVIVAQLQRGKRLGSWIRELVETAYRNALSDGTLVFQEKIGGATASYYGAHAIAKVRANQKTTKKGDRT